MSKRMLSTIEVARALGVSAPTIKRWADEGLLAAEKTVGGHRRFPIEEVVGFQAKQGQGLKHQDHLPELSLKSRDYAGAESSTDSIFDALLTGDSQQVAAIIVNAYMHNVSMAFIFDRMICPAMRTIGELWFQGELTIAQEHLATRTVLEAASSLRGFSKLPTPIPLKTICCSVEEDFHELPVYLAQTLLESFGATVINLGTNTPFFALAEALDDHHPKLVCVSSTILNNVDRAAREYKGLHLMTEKRGILIILGGKGFADERLRRRFPADLHAESFEQLTTFMRGVMINQTTHE